MEPSFDFLKLLDPDMSLKILMCLEATDLIRLCVVSRSWRFFVIANSLCKQVCLRMFPHLHKVDRVVEPGRGVNTYLKFNFDTPAEWETLEKEHRAYAFLARACTSFLIKECIGDAISASSTDNFPSESIVNTLERRSKVAGRPSYWSSKGQSSPMLPERLTYKLVADICVVTEICIRPFQAFFQWGLPIYSSQSVRFRLGHSKVPINVPMAEPLDYIDDHRFIWTFTSPEYRMTHENRLQSFKLPEPILCIGGFVQIELSGRVQRQEMDGLYYICICHVQVLGRSLSPAFAVENLEPSGKFILKVQNYDQPRSTELEAASEYLQDRVRELERIVNLLRLRGVEVEVEGYD